MKKLISITVILRKFSGREQLQDKFRRHDIVYIYLTRRIGRIFTQEDKRVTHEEGIKDGGARLDSIATGKMIISRDTCLCEVRAHVHTVRE